MTGHTWHLMLNHLPVVGSVWALLLALFVLARPHPRTLRLAAGLILAVGLSAVPVFLTGERAEEEIAGLAGVSQSAAGDHEDMGKRALAATGLAAAAGAGALVVYRRKPDAGRVPLVLATAVLIVAVAVLYVTAETGGRIHRPELRGEAPWPSPSDR
jgi:hypothetical protein